MSKVGNKSGIHGKFFGVIVAKLRPYNECDARGLARLAHEVLGDEWTTVDCRHQMLKANTVCWGIYREELLIGTVMVHLGHVAAQVRNVMVLPEWQRSGYGTMLLKIVDNTLLDEHRRIMEIHVPDTNLGMHVFLRSIGVKATEVLGDSYLFRAEKGFSKKIKKKITSPD